MSLAVLCSFGGGRVHWLAQVLVLGLILTSVSLHALFVAVLHRQKNHTH